MKKYSLLLLVLLIPFFDLFAHPIYISVTEVHYDKNSKSCELSIKCFADDLEKALSEWNDEKFQLSKEMSESDQKKLASYIKDHIDFSRDGKDFDEKFIGYEIENEVIFCYLQIEVGRKPLPLDLENSLMLESIEEQENIMHFEIEDQKKSFRLNMSERKSSIAA